METQSPAQTKNPVLAPQASVKKPDFFKIFFPILGFLIIFIVFGNIYISLKKQTSSAVPVTPTPIPTQVIITPAIFPTINWTVYTNEKYKCSFGYPDDIELKLYQTSQGKLEEFPHLFNKKYGDVSTMWFFVKDNPNRMEIKAFLDYDFQKEKKEAEQTNVPLPLELENGKYVTINNIRGYQGTAFAADSQALLTYLPNDNYVIGIRFDDSNPNFAFAQENKELFLQILSTFKFLP